MTNWRVEVVNGGFTWYLRGTTWTSDPARAYSFPTEAKAREGLERAKPFTQAKLYKAARFVEMEAEG
jgi:hypothetical protein